MRSGPRAYALRNLFRPSPNPSNRRFGWDRGTPIDRIFIEEFLQSNAERIQGAVLEIGERTYTQRFGTNVAKSAVLHAVTGNPEATIVGDLVSGAGLDSETYDCVLLTQTLPFVSDPNASLGHVFRSLRRGGSVLATVPGISQVSRYDMEIWGDYWRFMPQGCEMMFKRHFGADNVRVFTYGNVYCAGRFLEGFCAEEIPKRMLEVHDPEYPVVIGIVATRA